MIFTAVERMVAMRYLRARREEGFISIVAWFSLIGIALGVATLIIVMAVMNGFRNELLERILGVNGNIALFTSAEPLTNYENIVREIKKIDAVADAFPIVEGQVLATANGIPSFGQVRGIKPEDLARRAIIANNIKAGSIQAMAEEGILIGTKMATRMGLQVGDSISLLNPRGIATVIGTVPRIKNYKIAGFFNVGMMEYDSSFIYMPLEEAKVFFKTGTGINEIEVTLHNPELDLYASNRLMLLPEITNLPNNKRMFIRNWLNANSGFITAVNVERNVMFLILTLIILVAAFNIISSMIMMVKSKGRDIAVMRTMGATRGMILRIFLLSGASVGIIGTCAGFIIGVVFCSYIEEFRQLMQSLTGTNLFSPEVYFLSRLPAKLEWQEVWQVVSMALGLSVLATIYPAWRAAKLDPIEALRYE